MSLSVVDLCFVFCDRHKSVYMNIQAAAQYEWETGDLFLFPLTIFEKLAGEEFAESMRW